LVTVFVFIGVEGASVYSRYAKTRADVGFATVTGFIGVLCLMILVTLLCYGVLTRPELGALRQPSMAGALEAVVGPWGAKFVSAGLIISVLGAYLAWSLLAAEVAFSAARSDLMPAFLKHENENQVPSTALWLTNIIVQIFLIVTLFAQYAFDVALELTSAMTLIPYVLVAGYGLKLAQRGETYEKAPDERRSDLIYATIATVYTAFMIYAGGLKFVLLSCILFAPGTLLLPHRAAGAGPASLHPARAPTVRRDRGRRCRRSVWARDRRDHDLALMHQPDSAPEAAPIQIREAWDAESHR
jgi:arginine:ornithine antiporter / lysine permease